MKPTNAHVSKCVPSHIVNYQQVSMSRAIVIRAALQEYLEYNTLPNYISGTDQRDSEGLKLSIWSQNRSLCTVKIK